MCTFHGLVKSQKPLSGLIHHSWELTWGQKLPEEKKRMGIKTLQQHASLAWGYYMEYDHIIDPSIEI